MEGDINFDGSGKIVNVWVDEAQTRWRVPPQFLASSRESGVRGSHEHPEDEFHVVHAWPKIHGASARTSVAVGDYRLAEGPLADSGIGGLNGLFKS